MNAKQYRGTLQVPLLIGKERPTDLYRSIYRHCLYIKDNLPIFEYTCIPIQSTTCVDILYSTFENGRSIPIMIMDLSTFICHLYAIYMPFICATLGPTSLLQSFYIKSSFSYFIHVNYIFHATSTRLIMCKYIHVYVRSEYLRTSFSILKAI